MAGLARMQFLENALRLKTRKTCQSREFSIRAWKKLRVVKSSFTLRKSHIQREKAIFSVKSSYSAGKSYMQ